MDQMKQRVLILTGKHNNQPAVSAALRAIYEVDTFDKMEDAMHALRNRTYHAIFADVGDFLPLERALVGQQSSVVLNTIGEGVCIVDADGRCAWSNNRLRSFPPEVVQKVRAICGQARAVFSQQVSPTSDGSPHRSKKYTFQADDDRYFEMITSPVIDEQAHVRQVVAVVWDATSGRRLQQKINAIDSAGRELAKLEAEAIAKLTPGQRLQLLQDKIIRFSKELLHFDHFAIRLVDKKTHKLELVIAEGLPREALEIDLYAQPEGNGISGYVAATARSYICHDTEKDPRYVTGIHHCKSSLTVPLKLHDKVIGIFNIESETVGAFDEDDRQFAEIFGQYVALALNILDILRVDRVNTFGQLAESVVQEMGQPLSHIVTEAQSLMEEYIGDDSMRERLNKIVGFVQDIRSSLADVKAGPQRVIGFDRASAKKTDALLAGKRVLIADDELNIRKTIGEVLAKYSCEISVCKDGYEAINLIEQQDFDLIVSDIKMPHSTGYDIFAAARRRRDDLPVILMTGFGYDPHHSIVRASQEGLSTVLFKPFKVDQLLDEVRKALTPKATSAPPPPPPPPSPATPPPTPDASPDAKQVRPPS
ncbi:MAG: response regulator [Planctomycetota bacterium]|nr:response regulator [Planctomycetota bacterium]